MTDLDNPSAPSLPPLRIRRDWEWEPVPGTEVHLGGGPGPMVLKSIDTLEMQVAGEWTTVPVTSGPIPENPQTAHAKRRASLMAGNPLAEQEASFRVPGLHG